LGDKCQPDGIVQNVNEGFSGRPCSSTDDDSVESVTGFHTISKEVCKVMLKETGICKTTVIVFYCARSGNPKRKCGIIYPNLPT
jgi:hypothetical protein